MQGYLDIVKFLIRRGAEVNTVNKVMIFIIVNKFYEGSYPGYYHP